MENRRDKKNNKRSNNFILIAILVSLVFWVIDAVIDTFIFKEGDFLTNLAGLNNMEIWMRVIIMLMIFTFALYSRKKILERDNLISIISPLG